MRARAQLLCEVQRLLRPGGAHVVVSFRARRFLERLLDAPPLACRLTAYPISAAAATTTTTTIPAFSSSSASVTNSTSHVLPEAGGGEQAGGAAHVYVVRKGPGSPQAWDDDAPLAAAVRAHVDAVIRVRTRASLRARGDGGGDGGGGTHARIRALATAAGARSRRA